MSITLMPPEIIQQIMNYLSLPDRMRLGKSCQRFYMKLLTDPIYECIQPQPWPESFRIFAVLGDALGLNHEYFLNFVTTHYFYLTVSCYRGVLIQLGHRKIDPNLPRENINKNLDYLLNQVYLPYWIQKKKDCNYFNMKLLKYALAEGNLVLVQYIFPKVYQIVISSQDDNKSPLRKLGDDKQLDTMRWLAETQNILTEKLFDKWFNNGRAKKSLSVLLYLLDVQTRMKFTRSINYYVAACFDLACEQNNLKIAQRVHREYPDIIKSECNIAILFRYAHTYDHLQMAKWLYSIYPQIPKNVTARSRIKNTMVLREKYDHITDKLYNGCTFVFQKIQNESQKLSKLILVPLLLLASIIVIILFFQQFIM